MRDRTCKRLLPIAWRTNSQNESLFFQSVLESKMSMLCREQLCQQKSGGEPTDVCPEGDASGAMHGVRGSSNAGRRTT